MTETTILDEGAVDELLVRAIKDHDEGADLASCHIPALCATVRRLRAELTAVRDELRVADDALENQSQWMSESREKLAAVTLERDDLQSQLEQLQKQGDGYRRLLALAEEQNEELLEQVSQLEQLRSENAALRKELANLEKYQAQLLDSDRSDQVKPGEK